jgi:hypothetical protein
LLRVLRALPLSTCHTVLALHLSHIKTETQASSCQPLSNDGLCWFSLDRLCL